MQRQGTPPRRRCGGAAHPVAGRAGRHGHRRTFPGGHDLRPGGHPEPQRPAESFRPRARGRGAQRRDAEKPRRRHGNPARRRPPGAPPALRRGERTGGVSVLHGAGHRRRAGRTQPRLAALAAGSRRRAPDQQRGRCHQLRDDGTRPAAARLRRGAGRPFGHRRATRQPRRGTQGARRTHLQTVAASPRHRAGERRERRRRRGRGARGHHGRRGQRRDGRDDDDHPGKRLLRAHGHPPNLARTGVEQRGELPFRARGRSRGRARRLAPGGGPPVAGLRGHPAGDGADEGVPRPRRPRQRGGGPRATAVVAGGTDARRTHHVATGRRDPHRLRAGKSRRSHPRRQDRGGRIGMDRPFLPARPPARGGPDRGNRPRPRPGSGGEPHRRLGRAVVVGGQGI